MQQERANRSAPGWLLRRGYWEGVVGGTSYRLCRWECHDCGKSDEAGRPRSIIRRMPLKSAQVRLICPAPGYRGTLAVQTSAWTLATLVSKS